MSKKTKTIFILILIITLVLLMILLGTMPLEAKTQMPLGTDRKVVLNREKIALNVDNVYCINNAQWLSKYADFTYEAVAKAEINGESVTFTNYYGGSDGQTTTTVVGTTCSQNNVMAAIVTATGIDKGFSYYDHDDYTSYTEAQMGVYFYYNQWYKAATNWQEEAKREGLTSASGFVLGPSSNTDTSKFSSVEWNGTTTVKVNYKERGNNTITTATNLASTNYYNADLYFLKFRSATQNGETIDVSGLQNLMLVVPGNPQPKITQVTVQKVWVDEGNRDGVRPESIQVRLYGNGTEVTTDANGNAITNPITLSEKNGWKHTFTNLRAGVNYTVQETGVPDRYSINIVENQTSGYTITNTHTPEKINIPVTKVWVDEGDRDGVRPESIQVRLYGNGTEVTTDANGNAITNPITLSEKNGWKHTFTNLYKYENGNEIIYTVEEVTVPTGYTQTAEDKSNRYTITNAHTPEKIDIPVEKIWDDEGDRDGARPESIQVTLYGNNRIITTDADNNTIANPITLSEKNGWKHTFTNLYKYENGSEITYTIQETQIEENREYETQYSGFTITNKLIPERTTVRVIKKWDDEDDRDGKRPVSIQVTLYDGNGAKVTKDADNNTIKNPITLSEDNDWTYTFENLYRYENHGQEIKYKVEEETIAYYNRGPDKKEPEKPEYHRDFVEATDASTALISWTITNTHIPERTRVQVTKVWEDENDLDEYRRSIQVTLYGNGTKVTKDVDGKTITNPITLSEGNWTYTFENLYRYENKKEIDYTVKEETIEHYNEPNYKKSFTEATDSQTALISWEITNTHIPHYDGYIEISGKVWLDGKAGKDNTINGRLDSNEKGISGIRVTLKNANGSDFTTGNKKYVTETDSKGEYKFLVNYDNSQNVYKLYENVDNVNDKLKTAYVEFEYDGMTYTTVSKATSGANTSKAIENEKTRNALDSAHATVTPSTKHPSEWTDKNITAVTNDVISFENYTDKTTEQRPEVLKYCNGNGTYIRTNPEGAWKDILPGKIEKLACNKGSGHEIIKHDVEVTKIQNVNLGLFEREQPDVAIFSDLTKVDVIMNGQQYTYKYGVRSDESNDVGLQVKFQNKKTYTYRRPVNPADIAYVNDGHKDAMQVFVTYEVKVANLSSTLQMTVDSILAAYDSQYTVKSIKKGNQDIGNENSTLYPYQPTIKLKNLNITLQGGHESSNDDVITITYEVSQTAIEGLLNDDATLNTGYEIYQYSTEYGKTTLYAEQRTHEKEVEQGRKGRAGNSYAGYDYDSHPGNANIQLKTDSDGVSRLKSTDKQGNIIPENQIEDDTDFAPSFVLCKDGPKILSGNVWEDSSTITQDGGRLGNGKKDAYAYEKNLANAKVELLKVKDDGTLEPAYLYNETTNEKIEAVTYSDNNGNYSFGNGDSGYSVVTDRYVMKFTYGEGIEGNIDSTINDFKVNARNYKSTIISPNTELYNVFKGKSSSEEWHLKIKKGYSVAVDEMEQRVAIEDLQYSNFGVKINMTAYSKPFKMQVEFDPSGESQVGEDGITTFGNELNVFDFGIIERAREDIYVDKTVTYLKVTLANGQVLTEGNPNQKLNYVKTMGFNQNIKNGAKAKEALDKQMLIEMDSELIQGAQIEVKYQVKVINNSEKDFDYYLGDTAGEYDPSKVRTEYYYFGTNNEKSPVITSSVNYLVDYVGADIANGYTWENPDRWKKVTADSLCESGKEFICGAASDTIKSNKYVAYVTTQYSELAPGETSTPENATAKKLLANQDENVLENHLEILQIDAKSARTIKGKDEKGEKIVDKEYKPGDYVPSLEPRPIKTGFDENAGFEEKAGLHEQDDDRVKVMITNATGVTNYITTYVITGAIGLIVIAVVIVFIKKKVLTK